MTPDRHPIDEQVRQHLERTASQIDGHAMLARVKASRTPVTVSRRHWLRYAAGVGVGGAIAAGVAGFLFMAPQEVLASPEQLIEEAQEAHAQPLDRCYRLTAEWEPLLVRRLKLPPLARSYRIWTRKDEFWLQPDVEEPFWSMGQEASGRIWFSNSRKLAMVYERQEMEEPMQRFCDLLILKMVSTLAEFREKCLLQRTDTGKPGQPIRIEANLRPNLLNRNPRFQHVSLELDEQHMVRKVELDRLVNGERAGRLRFELIDTANQPAELYQLQGHLDADAEILDAESARTERRRRMREEFLKRLQNRWK